jgi:hypothetical protein
MATRPKSAIAAISRLVAIGRLMNPSEIFTDHPCSQAVVGVAVIVAGALALILRVFTHVAMYV